MESEEGLGSGGGGIRNLGLYISPGRFFWIRHSRVSNHTGAPINTAKATLFAEIIKWCKTSWLSARPHSETARLTLILEGLREEIAKYTAQKN